MNDVAHFMLAANRFFPGRVTVPLPPLLRLFSYKDVKAVRKDVYEIAVWAAARVTELAAPVAIHRRLPIKKLADGQLELVGGRFFHSLQFASAFSECDEVVAFVLTLGPAVDDETLRLVVRDDIVEALFLEYAGWIAIERATHALAAHLQGGLTEIGLRLTRRLAPGYFDWPLEEQRDFVALFPADELPIHLLESCAIFPKKSRTGLYGLQPIVSEVRAPLDLTLDAPPELRRAACSRA